MISSCSECKNPCCKTGPGPWTAIPAEDYLDGFGTVAVYNKKCVALTDEGTCSYWKTPSLPVECRIHTCSLRTFSDDELSVIRNIQEFECENCGCEWIIRTYVGENQFRDTCEACGYVMRWDGCIEEEGNPELKKPV